MKQEIVADIRKVAERLGLKPGERFSRSEYLSNEARFSHDNLYDGGMNFTIYCEEAGYKPKTKEPVSDEAYFERYQKAVSVLGRPPKSSERIMFGLTVPGRRRRILDEFRNRVTSPGNGEVETSKSIEKREGQPKSREHSEKDDVVGSEYSRPIPPIPEKTRRKKWERTGIPGHPYAPQDESGVIALLAILCANGVLPWQILDLNSGKGIDAVVYDDRQQRELRVELKHTLSRPSWNHPVDSLDCVVCWENRWKDFPKRVIELRSLVKK